MFKFLKKDITTEFVKNFEDVIDAVKFCLYKILIDIYAKEMDDDKASVLAVQVLNYLLDYDLDVVYKSVTDDVKKQILEIKPIVKSKSIEFINKDVEIADVITLCLMAKDHYLQILNNNQMDQDFQRRALFSIELENNSKTSISTETENGLLTNHQMIDLFNNRVLSFLKTYN